MSKPTEGLEGKQFGRLTVIKRVESRNGRTRWLCKCNCPDENEVIVYTYSLTSGNTTSCSCIQKERRIENIINYHGYYHGMSGTRIHNIWLSMKDRCNNPNNSDYLHYGGRGIIVCEEWNKSFELFYQWATDNGYTEELTIDRIDENGNYVSSNCRWVNSEVQVINRRMNNTNTSGFVGVHYSKNNKKWVARIGFNYKRIHLGYFNTPEEANQAYQEAKKKYHNAYIEEFLEKQKEEFNDSRRVN